MLASFTKYDAQIDSINRSRATESAIKELEEPDLSETDPQTEFKEAEEEAEEE